MPITLKFLTIHILEASLRVRTQFSFASRFPDINAVFAAPSLLSGTNKTTSRDSGALFISLLPLQGLAPGDACIDTIMIVTREVHSQSRRIAALNLSWWEFFERSGRR